MPFVYSQVTSLRHKPKVGSTQCVALVQFYGGVPHHVAWRPGASVFGNKEILPGTAIATFVNGRYPSAATGNHAAFYVRQDASGIWVIDQWKDKPGGTIRNIEERLIRSRHLKQHKNGTWPFASDNADAYSVIELR